MKSFIILLSALLLLTAVVANASEKISLNEIILLKFIADDPPTVMNIEASFLSTDATRAITNDFYSTTLSATANILDSDEKSLNAFIPVTSSYKSMTVSLDRPLQYGAVLGAKVFTEKSTNDLLKNAVTSGYGVSLNIDLYKDLFGRTSRANIDMTEAASYRASLEKQIQLAEFKNNLRKIYWSLVTNQESLKITKTLLASSKKQLRDANKRYRSGVADKRELARYKSQISSRKASLISITWQKSQLKQKLKLLLPKLSEVEIVLAPYAIERTVKNVMSCFSIIKKYKKAPLGYTKYDEIIGFLNREEVSKNKITNNYDSPDLKLIGEYESTGKAYSQSDSLSDLNNDGRGSLKIGIKFSMPFGGSKKDTRKIQNKINKRTYTATKREALARVNAYHFQTIKSVELLNQIVLNQKENTKHLGESLSASKRKYSQARITAQQLVQEQDDFLQSSLDEISTKRAIINLLLDYFNVFTDMPCELNRTI